MNTATNPLTLAQALEWVVTAYRSGKLAEAERLCRTILRSDPAQVDALNVLGSLLLHRAELPAALELFTRASELDPTFTDALYNRAVVLGRLERWDEALAAYDRVVALDPANARAWNNRGNVLQKLDRHDEALACYDRVLELRPGHPETLNNRGLVLLALAHPREARVDFERAVAADPKFAEAQWSLSLTHLLLGEFEPGWRLHEWRWKTQQMAHLARDFREPPWLGETSLAGKTLLLHGDQGLGDTLQMVRYAPLTLPLAARVILEVHPYLARLMASLSPWIEVVARGEALPRFDAHTPLGSLPLAFRTTLATIPAPIPYLHAAPERAAAWAARLGPKSRPRVGIAWSGNPALKRDAERSIAFERLRALLRPEVEFHCVQTQFRDGEENLARESGMRMWKEELFDFTETAALVENLDLVISVDTSVAHLAGALGKQTWILLPQVPDYRWLLDREDSPWYPTARLFRQPRRGDWESVVAKVDESLRRMLAA